MESNVKCPKCELEWQEPCEQTACIELFGECISCRRFVLTTEEVNQIQEKAGTKNEVES